MAASEGPPSWLAVWIMAVRPKTLFAAAAPVVIGTALAFDGGVGHGGAAACAMISALLIQIGTNFYNDYSDARKGADTTDRIGPLRVTQAGLLSERTVFNATIAAFGLAVVFGSYLMFRGGLPIVLIGIFSISFGFLYSASRFSLSSIGIADVAVILFFGPVAVGGTYFVQALHLTPAVLIAGLAPGFLAAGILAVNNVRDIEQDRNSGRKTLVVRFGRLFGVALYAVNLMIAALIPVVLVIAYGFPPAVILASTIVIPALPMIGRLASSSDGAVLNLLLAKTGGLLLLYSILFSIGLWAD